MPSVADLPPGTGDPGDQTGAAEDRAHPAESSDSVARGSATRTDPGAGGLTSGRLAVTLFISSGKPQVNVPDVTNETQGAATAALKNAGFR